MDKMAMTPKGLRLLLAGLVVMIAGFILMTGQPSGVPGGTAFDYSIFDFRRTVAAPIVIIAGIVVEIVAIMGPKNKKEE